MATDCDTVQCRCTPVSESDWDDDQCPPSVALVDAVAAAEGVDPMELAPVSDEIDLEALDQLLLNSPSDTCGIFQFQIADWNVFVSGNGHIKLCDPSETTQLATVFGPVSAD